MICRVALSLEHHDSRVSKPWPVRRIKCKRHTGQRHKIIAFARIDDDIVEDAFEDDDDEFWEEFGEKDANDAALVDSDVQSDADQSQAARQVSKEDLRMEFAKPDDGGTGMLPVVAGAGALLAAGVFLWRRRGSSATDSDSISAVRGFHLHICS